MTTEANTTTLPDRAELQARYDALKVERLAEAAERLAQVEAIDPQDWIGKVIDYDPQPYGPRKVRIESMQLKHFKQSCWPYADAASWVVYGKVVEGHSVSRLFHATSSRDITGDSETIYGVSPQDLAKLQKTTAYCG